MTNVVIGLIIVGVVCGLFYGFARSRGGSSGGGRVVTFPPNRPTNGGDGDNDNIEA
ncbi:MAG: hypothetical protein VW683_00205 [Betaproteobacteria bacterium]|jgi:uncharacterized membrane-anchored protein YitT (DUF2179 family)